MSDYTEAEALRAEIIRLIAVEKALDEEFQALPEGSAEAASTARAAIQIADQIRRLETELGQSGVTDPSNKRRITRPAARRSNKDSSRNPRGRRSEGTRARLAEVPRS